MAFGTGFMALAFIFLGIPLWRAARASGAITPPELIWQRFGNRPLRVAYLLVMVVFTLPYLALQPIGAGIALQQLLGIPFAWGAVTVTVVGVLYLLLGGMRGDAWTDALQGIVMLAAMLAVFFGVAHALGGLGAANARVFAERPELFSRPGGGMEFTVGVWFSYMALWFLCDPMFPQLFQRFLAAKNERALRATAVLYPLITGVLFFIPVAVGVMGRLVEPGLAGKAADGILPLAVGRLLPGWMGAVAIAGAMAALMSTMDSQLLTLSSMLVRDVRQLTGRPAESRFPWDRVAIVLLAGAGLALALRPWATIRIIATQTFTGLAVLFPVTFAAVYWRRANPWAAFASIVAGEALVVLYQLKLLPTFGLLPVVPVVLVATLVLVIGSLVRPGRGVEPWARIGASSWRWIAAFGLLFVAAHDFWNWNRSDIGWLGLPKWLWYFFGLQALLLLALLAYHLVRSRAALTRADGADTLPVSESE
jgi:SSS family solute:Na+ symporter